MDINAAYRRKRIILFLAISVGYLVVFFQRVAPAIVGPVMADELGLAATDLGIMASMYFWAQAAGCIPAGLFSDTFGPRKIIAVGLICASAGTAV
ncbi:MFS transporter, partial [Bilophila wadsworthia]